MFEIELTDEVKDRYEACARCGRYHQLIQANPSPGVVLWLQPRHPCGTEFQE